MEFELICSKTESSFSLVEKLQVSESIERQMILFLWGGDDVYYKNTVKKVKLKYSELLGEPFSVILDYDLYKWNITGEIKIVNGLQCYKATACYEEYDKKRDITLTFNPVVWFTPDIPIPYGPKGIDGVPGLVLEASINGKSYIYATEIEYSFKGEINRPKKGREVSQNEYMELLFERNNN